MDTVETESSCSKLYAPLVDYGLVLIVKGGKFPKGILQHYVRQMMNCTSYLWWTTTMEIDIAFTHGEKIGET